jgi:hypothetical protein
VRSADAALSAGASGFVLGSAHTCNRLFGHPPGYLKLPRHGSKEIKTGTYRGILKDLGLEERWRWNIRLDSNPPLRAGLW